MRRVQYELKGFVYIASTSDMDGKSLEPERVHHHVVIEREALEICRRKWARYGVIYERELYSSNGDFYAPGKLYNQTGAGSPWHQKIYSQPQYRAPRGHGAPPGDQILRK